MWQSWDPNPGLTLTLTSKDRESSSPGTGTVTVTEGSRGGLGRRQPHLPEVLPALRALVVQLIGKSRHEVLQVSQLQGRPDFLVRVLAERVQVHAEGTRKQNRVLFREKAGDGM